MSSPVSPEARNEILKEIIKSPKDYGYNFLSVGGYATNQGFIDPKKGAFEPDLVFGTWPNSPAETTGKVAPLSLKDALISGSWHESITKHDLRLSNFQSQLPGLLELKVIFNEAIMKYLANNDIRRRPAGYSGETPVLDWSRDNGLPTAVLGVTLDNDFKGSVSPSGLLRACGLRLGGTDKFNFLVLGNEFNRQVGPVSLNVGPRWFREV
jgi:hypothetical protein